MKMHWILTLILAAVGGLMLQAGLGAGDEKEKAPKKKGDADKDRVLTEARSMVVRDYLVKNFKLDDTRIKTIGFGKAKEAGDNSAVEIMVYPAGLNARASR